MACKSINTITCKRIPLTITLNGTTWVTIEEFCCHAYVYEILVKVPTLANASNVLFGVFDPDYQVDGDERWNSGNVPEGTTTDIGLDRVIVPGNLLEIKADTAATEVVSLVIYLVGV